jgi:hypothetical protein
MAEGRKNKPGLVVAKFDRLFRSVADAAQTSPLKWRSISCWPAIGHLRICAKL